MTEDKLILLGRVYNPVLANIAKSILESHDIPCFLFDSEHAVAPWDIGLSMGAIRLMVLESDKDNSIKILQSEMKDEDLDFE